MYYTRSRKKILLEKAVLKVKSTLNFNSQTFSASSRFNLWNNVQYKTRMWHNFSTLDISDICVMAKL